MMSGKYFNAKNKIMIDEVDNLGKITVAEKIEQPAALPFVEAESVNNTFSLNCSTRLDDLFNRGDR
jgi:hypothetical protein